MILLRPMSTLSRILLALALAGLLGCERDPGARDHTLGLHFPVGVVADPSGDRVYVVNSNFDLLYNGGAVVAIDTATNRLVPGVLAQIPSFGAQIAATSLKDAQGTMRTHLFVASRAGDAMSWLEVRDDASGNPTLFCAPNGVDSGRVHTCNGTHLFADAASPGAQPFGVAVRPTTDVAGVGHVYATTFGGTLGVVSLETLSDGTFRTLYQTRVALLSGLYSVAVHPITGRAYASTKSGGLIANADVRDVEGPGDRLIVQVDRQSDIVIENPTGGRDFGRDLEFSHDGSLLYVAYRTPPGLVVIDTGLGTDGRPRNRVLGTVPLPAGAAAVAVAPSGPGGAERVYVTLFSRDEVHVIDPIRMEVVDMIDVGSRPFDITVVQKTGLLRAYVSLFEESAVGVIELDPASPFYHQEIVRVRR